jgi:maleylpyruvate isomerase
MKFDDLDLDRKRHLVNEGSRHFWRFVPKVDAALDAPSRLDGWTRRQLAAHLGYNAAALRRMVEGVARGVPAPMYSSPEQRSREIAEAVNLDAVALRRLFDNEHDRLHVAWCELSPSDWDATVTTPQGKPVPVAATLWMRNREVWECMRWISVWGRGSIRLRPLSKCGCSTKSPRLGAIAALRSSNMGGRRGF